MKTLSSTSTCMECEKDGLFLAKDESGFYYISCCLCGKIFFKCRIEEGHNDQLPAGRMFAMKFNHWQQSFKNPAHCKNALVQSQLFK